MARHDFKLLENAIRGLVVGLKWLKMSENGLRWFESSGDMAGVMAGNG